MNSDEHSDERIDRSLDGRLTPEEWESLQRDLLEDEELRRAYVERRWLHAQLLAEGGSLPSLLPAGEKASLPRRRFGWGAMIASAAAAVAIAGLAAFPLIPKSAAEPSVATLVEADGCQWAGSELPTTEGARLGAGTLSLVEGMAVIRFDSGAEVTMEAPTSLEVESAMRCLLLDGSVVADVPEPAHGFTIDTAEMEVVDLGTRFGVTNSPVGGSHVFVFDGEVQVHREESPEPEHVRSGKSVHFGATPATPSEEVSRVAPTSPKEGNWKALSTAMGRGKDGYIRRGDTHGPTGAQPMVMVKHTELAATNVRRGLLTFDLEALADAPVEAAKLTLQIESSGLGFASLVPDSVFSVYGVHDPAIDAWREDSLLWENAPDVLTADALDSERFTRLAQFEIGKGASHGLVEVTSEPLRDFLRKRGDGLATLLLVRETGEFDTQGLVHAFASKEHPAGPAPTLWIRTDPNP